MQNIEELKEKFLLLQQTHQRLREEKIRLESEIKTMQTDYDNKLKELLAATGTHSLEEAVRVCEDQKARLDDDASRLALELDRYLSPTGQEDVSSHPYSQPYPEPERN